MSQMSKCKRRVSRACYVQDTFFEDEWIKERKKPYDTLKFIAVFFFLLYFIYILHITSRQESYTKMLFYTSFTYTPTRDVFGCIQKLDIFRSGSIVLRKISKHRRKYLFDVFRYDAFFSLSLASCFYYAPDKCYYLPGILMRS